MLVGPSVNPPKNLKKTQKSAKETLDVDTEVRVGNIVGSVLVGLRVFDWTNAVDIQRGSNRTNISFVRKKSPMTRGLVTRQDQLFIRQLQEVGQVSFITAFKQLKVMHRRRNVVGDMCAEVWRLSADHNFCLQTIGMVL